MSCKRRSTKRSFLAPTGSKKQSFTPNGNRVKTANCTLPGPIYGRCHINRQSLEFNLAAQEQSAHPPCDRPLKKLGVEPFHPLVHHLCAAALLRQPRQSTTVRRQPNFFHHLWIIFLALAESPKKKGWNGSTPPLQYHPNAFNIADFKVASNLASMFSRSMRIVRFFASKTNFPVCPPLPSKRSSCFCFEGGGTVPPPSVSRLKTSPAGSFCLSSCISFDFARTPSGSR